MSSQSQSPIHVYVDVDDTLVRSVGTKRIAIPSVIQHVRDLHASGAILYCWSAGGADYARASAEEFGLASTTFVVSFIVSFGVVKAAQARGDFQVLVDRGRRALRVHIGKDVAEGLKELAVII